MHHCQRSASPNLSRQCLSKCSSSCWCGSPGNQETPQPSAAGVTNAWCAINTQKRLKTSKISAFPSCASQMRMIHSCTLIPPQRMSKTLLPLCCSASLFRPCRAPRTHLQIKTHPLLFTGSICLCSPLCASPTWANRRVTFSKPAGKLDPGALSSTTSHCSEETLFSTLTLFMGANVHLISDVSCRGKLKQEPPQFGPNTLKKGCKHLAASLYLSVILN